MPKSFKALLDNQRKQAWRRQNQSFYLIREQLGFHKLNLFNRKQIKLFEIQMPELYVKEQNAQTIIATSLWLQDPFYKRFNKHHDCLGTYVIFERKKVYCQFWLDDTYLRHTSKRKSLT